MTANPIAFDMTVSATPVRVSNVALIADIAITNTTASRTVFVSTDGGITRASIPTNVQVRLSGVNLNELWVYANGAGTVVSIVGNSRSR
jgi:hypothetical protein